MYIKVIVIYYFKLLFNRLFNMLLDLLDFLSGVLTFNLFKGVLVRLSLINSKKAVFCHNVAVTRLKRTA